MNRFNFGMSDIKNSPTYNDWRGRLYQVIFQSDTIAGKVFNIVLIICILLNVFFVILESVQYHKTQYGNLLQAAEWFLTILFSIEYFLRLISIRSPSKYALSFYGTIDLISIIPMYIEFFIPDSGNFLIIRILRLLRIFRIFKLSEYLYEADVLRKIVINSIKRITVFIFTILVIVIVISTLMYVIEGPSNGFTDIPTCIYWTIVTITTVGYGDIAPRTLSGKLLSSIVMLLGYAIIAVPTSIVTVELGRISQPNNLKACQTCGRNIDNNSSYCKYCGSPVK